MNNKLHVLSRKLKLNDITLRIKQRLHLETSEKVHGIFTSVFHHKGIEADASRPYGSGDDFGDIDIMTSSRHGATFDRDKLSMEIASRMFYIRQSRRERRSCLFLVLDLSKSMFYGFSRDASKESLYTTKLYLFYKLFYILYEYGLRNSFNVGVYICGQDKIIIPPSPSYVMRSVNVEKINSAVTRALSAKKSVNHTSRESLSSALRDVTKMLKTRNLVIVLSDFNAPWKEFAHQVQVMSGISRRSYIVPCHISDPKEFNSSVFGDDINKTVSIRIPIDVENGEFIEYTEQGISLAKRQEEIKYLRNQHMKKARLLPFEIDAGCNIDKIIKRKMTEYFSYYMNISQYIKPS